MGLRREEMIVISSQKREVNTAGRPTPQKLSPSLRREGKTVGNRKRCDGPSNSQLQERETRENVLTSVVFGINCFQVIKSI